MKVLIVSRYKDNLKNHIAPFVEEQVNALRRQGIECVFYLVKSKGIRGYIKEFPRLKKVIYEYQPDIIHAHYGLCGLLANLQRNVPVVTTYHGSDINNKFARHFSLISIILSAHNIFVSQKTADIVKQKRKYSIIPCGINLEDYPTIDKQDARMQMSLDPNKKYVLFAGAFDNPVKNPELAKKAISLLPGVILIELKGYTRHQVAMLMNAVDCFLMTSHSEGSPQVIKEAMACGCPIVSVDIGDVKERISGLEGCFITSKNADDISSSIQKALQFCGRTNGRERIIQLGLTNDVVADKVIEIYKSILQ